MGATAPEAKNRKVLLVDLLCRYLDELDRGLKHIGLTTGGARQILLNGNKRIMKNCNRHLSDLLALLERGLKIVVTSQSEPWLPTDDAVRNSNGSLCPINGYAVFSKF